MCGVSKPGLYEVKKKPEDPWADWYCPAALTKRATAACMKITVMLSSGRCGFSWAPVMRKVCIALLKTKSWKGSFSAQDGASCREIMFLISLLPERQKKYKTKYVLKYACVYMRDGKHRPRKDFLKNSASFMFSHRWKLSKPCGWESELRTRSASYLA